MEAIFKSNRQAGGNDAIIDGKVILTKIAWFLPKVIPTLEEKNDLLKLMESKEKFPVGFRKIQCENISPSLTRNYTWTLPVKELPNIPRYVIVGFQTDRRYDQKKNSAIFDNLNLQNIYIMLNENRFPAVDYKVDFGQHHFSRIYEDAISFRSKFLSMDELVSYSCISPSTYKSIFPLFVFDVSKQSERIEYSPINMRIYMTFGANVPANTEAYAVIISDRLITFTSDGKRMTILQ